VQQLKPRIACSVTARRTAADVTLVDDGFAGGAATERIAVGGRMAVDHA
jgi:hypothetical protein